MSRVSSADHPAGSGSSSDGDAGSGQAVTNPLYLPEEEPMSELRERLEALTLTLEDLLDRL